MRTEIRRERDQPERRATPEGSGELDAQGVRGQDDARSELFQSGRERGARVRARKTVGGNERTAAIPPFIDRPVGVWEEFDKPSVEAHVRPPRERRNEVIRVAVNSRDTFVLEFFGDRLSRHHVPGTRTPAEDQHTRRSHPSASREISFCRAGPKHGAPFRARDWYASVRPPAREK